MFKSEYFNRFINISIRGTILLSKLLFIVLIAKFLPVEEVAIYGIISVTIVYGSYPLGLNFHNYSARDIVKYDDCEKGRLIKSQIVLHLILYILILPFFGLIFKYELIPILYAWYFFGILIFEHLNNETHRLLIVHSKQLSASILLFLRQAAWVILIALVILIDEDQLSLRVILRSWLLLSFISFLVGCLFFWKMKFSGWTEKTDWRWIKKGIPVVIPLFVATISFESILVFDKYIFLHFNDEQSLGVYVFFISICASLVALVDAGVFAFLYPKMIISIQGGNIVEFKKSLNLMFKQTLVIILLFSVIGYIFAPVFLSMFDEIYLNNVSLFYMLLLATIVMCLSYVPHYGLYALRNDFNILIGNAIAFGLFIVCSLVFGSLFNFYGVVFALIITYTFTALIKSYFIYLSVNAQS